MAWQHKRLTQGDKRDPGYWSTSRMVLESALCLALDEEAVKRTGVCLELA